MHTLLTATQAEAEDREAALAERREQRASKARIAERAAELLQAELVRACSIRQYNTVS